MSNFRIKYISNILNRLQFDTMLDIGCRDCSLRHEIDKFVQNNNREGYFGCDLFQNSADSVKYVGNVMDMDFDRKFDCITALDILEHVDNPHKLVDKIFFLSNKYVVLSLPNCYDIRHKFLFCFKETLGNKYAFRTSNSLDRHRWVMNYDEIVVFYKYYANKFNYNLIISTIPTGSDNTKLINKIILWFLKFLISKKSMTNTVVGVFTKS